MRIFLAILIFASSALTLRAQDAAAGAQFLDKAKNAYIAEQFDAALAALDQFDKLKSPSANSLDLRGAVLMEQGKLDQAMADFRAARQQEPKLLAPQLHLAEALFRQKKFAEARQIFQSLAQETNILIAHERVLYGVLLTFLAQLDKEGARAALDKIRFPTETPAYYYAQAAWEFAAGNQREGRAWLHTAEQIFDPATRGWFAQPLYDLGWIKLKPSLTAL